MDAKRRELISAAQRFLFFGGRLRVRPRAGLDWSTSKRWLHIHRLTPMTPSYLELALRRRLRWRRWDTALLAPSTGWGLRGIDFWPADCLVLKIVTDGRRCGFSDTTPLSVLPLHPPMHKIWECSRRFSTDIADCFPATPRTRSSGPATIAPGCPCESSAITMSPPHLSAWMPPMPLTGEGEKRRSARDLVPATGPCRGFFFDPTRSTVVRWCVMQHAHAKRRRGRPRCCAHLPARHLDRLVARVQSLRARDDSPARRARAVLSWASTASRWTGRQASLDRPPHAVELNLRCLGTSCSTDVRHRRLRTHALPLKLTLRMRRRCAPSCGTLP